LPKYWARGRFDPADDVSDALLLLDTLHSLIDLSLLPAATIVESELNETLVRAFTAYKNQKLRRRRKGVG
jgi:hypothetical protein